jgi:hypothetical protein
MNLSLSFHSTDLLTALSFFLSSFFLYDYIVFSVYYDVCLQTDTFSRVSENNDIGTI